MYQEKENFIRSKVAVDVLKNLANRESGNYSTQISEDLDKTQSSISRILSELRDKGIVKKGQRTKAQYYEIDYPGLTCYWYNKIEKYLEEEGRPPESPETLYTFVEDFKTQEDEIKEFTESYFRLVIPQAEDIDLYELLFTTYALSMAFINGSEESVSGMEFPKYLKTTNLALIRFLDIPYFGGQVFQLLFKQD